MPISGTLKHLYSNRTHCAMRAKSVRSRT